MSAYQVNTYADGFGRWHSEVSIGDNGFGSNDVARSLAYAAIQAEIKQRNGADILRSVILEHRDSRDGTLTYYFREA